MNELQFQEIFKDINSSKYGFDKWIHPDEISYVVMKDNSSLRIDNQMMLYFDKIDGLVYVAAGILDVVNRPNMPTTGVTDESNLERVLSVINFDNFNSIVLHHNGTYFGGN